MLVHCRVTPSIILPVPIYTPGWREALWEWSVLPINTKQCPWPGLKPRPLDLEVSAVTMRPLCLPGVIFRGVNDNLFWYWTNFFSLLFPRKHPLSCYGSFFWCEIPPPPTPSPLLKSLSITLILPVTFHMRWAWIFPGTVGLGLKGFLLHPTSSIMVLGGSQYVPLPILHRSRDWSAAPAVQF